MKLNSLHTVIFCLFVLAMMSSCFKEEKPLLRPPVGAAEVVEIPLTSKYDKQFYFDLFTNQILSKKKKSSSDNKAIQCTKNSK